CYIIRIKNVSELLSLLLSQIVKLPTFWSNIKVKSTSKDGRQRQRRLDGSCWQILKGSSKSLVIRFDNRWAYIRSTATIFIRWVAIVTWRDGEDQRKNILDDLNDNIKDSEKNKQVLENT